MTKKLVKTRNDNSDCNKAAIEDHSEAHLQKTETKVQRSAVFEVVRHIKKSHRAGKAVNPSILKLRNALALVDGNVQE